MTGPPIGPDHAAALGAAVAETHISVLWFWGDRAYKLKKPVDFGFLDFSTRERREAACHREVALNRRLAPDVYLGVLDVVRDGEVVDHLVEMRRMPPELRLATLVAARGADPAADRSLEACIDAVAELVGRFHTTAERSPEVDAAADVDAVRRHWEDDVEAMAPSVGEVLDPATFERVAQRFRRFLDGRGSLFAQRIADGHAVDGHGDLQAADVFCLDDGPRVLDCIEFSDELRFGDVLADVAFLAMDLERLDAPDLAERLVERWASAAGTHGTVDALHRPLLHHYVAYRAHVRAKVACLRYRQEDPSDPARGAAADEARVLLELCDRHLDAARVRLVLVGGAPGTGKSTVAVGLAEATGWEVLRSDVVRKELAGLGPTDRAGAAAVGEGLYGAAMTEATYAELLARARPLLADGRSVVLDASWTRAEHRDAARALAVEAVADVVELRCELDPELAAARIRARAAEGTDASDADEAVAAVLAAAADPWPDAVVLDTSGRVEAVLDGARRHAGGC